MRSGIWTPGTSLGLGRSHHWLCEKYPVLCLELGTAISNAPKKGEEENKHEHHVLLQGSVLLLSFVSCTLK